MDRVIRKSRPIAPEAPFLPPEHPLAMPVQSLFDRRGPPAVPATMPRRILARRAFVFGLAGLLAALAAHEMHAVLNVGGLTALEASILVLFTLLNLWLALSLASAVGGFVAGLRARHSGIEIPAFEATPALRHRTAILIPTYNEAPARVLAGLEATYRSLDETGAMEAFDFFILSDTTEVDLWIAEEAEFLALRTRLGGGRNVFYRHRARNTDRKAGNIAEWVRRFGGAYGSMLVLDADSVMSGSSIVRLAGAMERFPGVGLIQTLPLMIGGTTVLARTQQFASRLNGPLIARGLAWWHGADGNFWGHNAILRVAAFAANAGMPHLAGRKPFGGPILSHDFVEAALLRRGGWAVHMAPDLGGSYEEGPPSLHDIAVRDRRWCQGNLQHKGVLSASGLALASRLHLAFGIAAYLASPLLLLMIVIGLAAALQAIFVPPDYFPSGFALFPKWPAQDPVRAAWVFAGTLAILLLPKLIALTGALADRRLRAAFGGGRRLIAGFGVEAALSALFAPITMVDQTRAVASVLSGRDSGWNPQRRDDGSLGWRDAVRCYALHTIIGLMLAGGAFAISFSMVLWMLPVFASLILAMPLSRLSASSRAGCALARAGLLCTPEEIDPPAPLKTLASLRQGLAQGEEHRVEALRRLSADPDLLRAHRAMLDNGGERPRGDHDPARLVARVKIRDAADLATALGSLARTEKMAAFGDTEALDALLALADSENGAPDRPQT